MRLAGFLIVLAVGAGAPCAGSLWGGRGQAMAQATQTPSFNLVNRTPLAIQELYVTPAGDARWGRNRLGTPLATGASFAVRRRIDGNCIFDIRLVFVDGHREDRRQVNTCNVAEIVLGGRAIDGAAATKAGDDPSFRLINRGAETIIELYATPTGLGRWGQNRLETPMIAGTDRIIHVDRQASCRFDVKVVLADHTAREKHNTDLCRITDIPVP